MLKKIGLQVLVALFAAGLFVVNAQTTTLGTISGTIRDEKGASIPNAEVVIQEVGIETSPRIVKTDDAGFYIANGLRPGKYTVSSSPSGFKKTVVTDVDLHVTES